MKKIRKLIAFVSMLSIFALFSVTAMAEERPENKEQSIEITFSDEYGDEIVADFMSCHQTALMSCL